MWQAFGTASDAMAHTSKKIYGKAADVFHRMKKEAPQHLDKVDAWLQHVKHANHHVAEHIQNVNKAGKRVSSYMLTSGLPPAISAVGEKLKDHAGHVHHRAMHLTNSAVEGTGEQIKKARHAFGAGINFH